MLKCKVDYFFFFVRQQILKRSNLPSHPQTPRKKILRKYAAGQYIMRIFFIKPFERKLEINNFTE